MYSMSLKGEEQEKLRQKYNPDGSLLRKDQMELLRMMQVFADICARNNIQWWLSSGTLLGAARHQGFIPWDDDADVVMLRKDYKRLEKILYNMQNEEFVFHTPKTDVEYVNVFGKFRKRSGSISTKARRNKYYQWTGIGFDIFAIEKTNYLSARLASVIYNNVQHLTSYIKISIIRRILIRIIEFLCLGVINPILRLTGMINPKGEYHYMLGTGWARHTFYMKDTFPLTTALFEGVEFPVPNNTDAYLANVYGDWRKLPSEDFIKKCIHCLQYRKEIYGE